MSIASRAVRAALLLCALLRASPSAGTETPREIELATADTAGLAIPAAQAAFASAQDAFQAVFIASGLARNAYDENREYAAAIYQMPDGHWYATRVLAGGRLSSSIPYHLVPRAAIRIAGAHTHGQPRLPEDPTHLYGTDFSQMDRRNAIRAYQASRGRIDTQLLLSSRLEVLEMSVSRGYDPASGWIGPIARTQTLLRD